MAVEDREEADDDRRGPQQWPPLGEDGEAEQEALARREGLGEGLSFNSRSLEAARLMRGPERGFMAFTRRGSAVFAPADPSSPGSGGDPRGDKPLDLGVGLQSQQDDGANESCHI